PLHEQHTRIFIAENIIEQVEYFGLGKQLLSLTMDNAANMDACGCHLATLLESQVLDDSQIEEDTIKGQIAKKISRKIDYYWNELQTYFHEAVLLDPSTKFTTFEHKNTISQTETQTETTSACDYFRRQIKQIHHSSFTLHNDVLDEYLNAPDEDINVLTYWKVKSSYLHWMPLARMAHDYLIVQVTSVTSEQIFSIAKHIISKT
ncbi:121_t:CDS:2, partial [Cetraspora pellucida]